MNKVNVVMVSSADSGGGASRAAYRLHDGLRRHTAIHSQMVVQKRLLDDADIHGAQGMVAYRMNMLRPTFEKIPLYMFRQGNATFTSGLIPSQLHMRINALNPEIVNLHWIGAGFSNIKTLKQLNKPIVWTLHDMWAFTGGCHYDEGCGRYQNSCGKCPQLNSQREKDLSRFVWKKKMKQWADIDLTIVCPSQWLATCAKQSALLRDRRIEVIPNGLDLNRFRPLDRHHARQWLGLPQDKQLILFGALRPNSELRKGFHHLDAVLQHMVDAGWSDRVELVVMGMSPHGANMPNFPFKTHYLGRLSDDATIAMAYSAVDIFIAPSIQDNLPNTVMESLACGTPSIAFEIGGMPDMIEHQFNGYLASPFDTQEMAEGVIWVLSDLERYEKLSERARVSAEEKYPLATQAYAYQQLYDEVLRK